LNIGYSVFNELGKVDFHFIFLDNSIAGFYRFSRPARWSLSPSGPILFARYYLNLPSQPHLYQPPNDGAEGSYAGLFFGGVPRTVRHPYHAWFHLLVSLLTSFGHNVYHCTSANIHLSNWGNYFWRVRLKR
jgi:hypothetical protein